MSVPGLLNFYVKVHKCQFEQKSNSVEKSKQVLKTIVVVVAIPGAMLLLLFQYLELYREFGLGQQGS